MRRSGSTRIEMFCRALNGSLSIFSIWSYVEIIRSLSIIQNNITLNSNFDRNQAVHLLYGDFSNLTEMVDVQNHLTIYVRKYLSEEEEMNGMTIQSTQTLFSHTNKNANIVRAESWLWRSLWTANLRKMQPRPTQKT